LILATSSTTMQTEAPSLDLHLLGLGKARRLDSDRLNLFSDRYLPVDLGPHLEQIRMDPVDIRLVVRRRQLQHMDPVRQEADPNVGIPVEPEGEILLPATLDVGAGADRLIFSSSSAASTRVSISPSISSFLFQFRRKVLG
jgi:hypothetical protein